MVYRRLYRATGTDARLVGVCAGLGNYFSIDPVAVRLLWVAVTLVTGLVPGVVLYLLAWLIVPEEPRPIAPPAAQPEHNHGT